ncbi:threonyl/alanyl tRNA synthetase [Aspergillus leporis]|uniref:Threonyl/alanyl tRNA synthetase n=1 Tax=Aspergillus leporis TaxID=41062 RepID=A0A5N5WQY1_9EURO|nr:threonyl/alanyl tRNA synthetase [Aspergillus leporis]
MAKTAPRTFLTYQHDANLHTLQTTVTAIQPYTSLKESNRQLFKEGGEEYYVIITEATIFHPQGGGQPSDIGVLEGPSGTTFTVSSVRMDTVQEGQVLHLGRFETQSSPIFTVGETVEQKIDVEKRLLYSRLHTAGHVLGAAVRHLLEHEIENFDELKASHFPDSAACEFQGLIEGKWKVPIQNEVDKYVASKAEVRVEWWGDDDFRAKGLGRLIPDRRLVPEGEKSRVVNIGGLEAYPCGGTHVDTTDQCGPVTVRKITRKVGNSRVSYAVN